MTNNLGQDPDTFSSDGYAPIIIRDMAPDERVAVVELTLAAYAEYQHQLPAAFWAVYRPNVESTTRDDPFAQRLVAVGGGTLLGSVLYYRPHARPPRPDRPSTGWPEVRLLAVAPSARGKGIGRALMKECLRRACEDGAPVLQLHSMSEMQIARDMYERMGFTRAPQLDFQPVEGIEVYGYTLDLQRDSVSHGSE